MRLLLVAIRAVLMLLLAWVLTGDIGGLKFYAVFWLVSLICIASDGISIEDMKWGSARDGEREARA